MPVVVRWWFAGIGLVVLRFVISSLGALFVWFWLIDVVFFVVWVGWLVWVLLVCWGLVWRGCFGVVVVMVLLQLGFGLGLLVLWFGLGVIHVLITVLVVFRRWLFEYVVCGLI